MTALHLECSGIRHSVNKLVKRRRSHGDENSLTTVHVETSFFVQTSNTNKRL